MTITNNGQITGTGGPGVIVNGPGDSVLTNSGQIQGNGGSAVQFNTVAGFTQTLNITGTGSINGNFVGSGDGGIVVVNGGNFNGGITINGNGNNSITTLAGHNINQQISITGNGQNTIIDGAAFNGGLLINGTGKWKAEEEVVTSAVPVIIAPHLFEQVQRQLHARSPKVAARRVTTGPILLTGLAVCATCNGGMTLRTGTSKTGAIHRYYACSTCARKGKTVCKGRSIPMAKLDTLVTTNMTEQLFRPERLAMILSSLASRRLEKADAVNARAIALQREVTDADDKLKRLYRLIEDGMTEMDDVLKDRLNSLKADRDRAKAALERAKSHSSQNIQIDPALLEQFGRSMCTGITRPWPNPEPGATT
ncbi:recombinase zinc beta ribbon domain-containing protein [Bradyrhizobium sp. SSUT112]|uniref:zinc ribbon domain-containing protein n=1 Tax=Bradyrhizobium sp. SSUT112 TaxID=3040604 RepID=UPI00244CF80A|nr:zinc ribbon domain-containing protein [Bradyrhizobium sp. SSUT112]MDH2350274.1 recombinase zinc beta ribbon domain-containing protein [Bradyrhizobium sp. SSUT112]